MMKRVLLSCAVLSAAFLTGSKAQAQVTFDAKVDYTSGNSPIGIAVGDLDGDGKDDLAVVNFGGTSVSVFRNTSASGSITSGSFAAKIDYATTGTPRGLAISDLDGDGKLDIAVSGASGFISVFRNTGSSGTISFASKVDFSSTGDLWGMAIGDLDGDGKPDLVASTGSNNTVSVLRNVSTSGSLSFETKVDFITGSGPRNVAIADLDGNGKLDIAVGNGAGTSLSVLRNTTTSGSFTSGSFASKADFATGNNPYGIAAADLDGDGKLELVTGNWGSNTVSVLRNTGTSGSISFATKVDFAASSSPWGITVGDLDGDGKAEIAVSHEDANVVSVFRNTSTIGAITTGSFAAKTDFATGARPIGVVIRDLDGDGRSDLATSNYSASTMSVIRSSTLIIPTITSLSAIAANPGAALTITGSGFNTTSANNTVYFGATKATVTSASATSLGVTVPTGATYKSVSVNNTALTLTGYSQYPFLPTYDNSAYVNNAVNFDSKVDFTASSSDPFCTAIADLDGDGKSDLVVGYNGSSFVSVYRNTSVSGTIDASSFSARVDFATAGSPRIVAIGDIDGDGKPDIVTVNQGTNNVSVLRNTSISGSITTSSFAAAVNFATGSSPYTVAIGDLDMDGKPDLAVSNFSANTVSVLRNTGTSGAVTSGSFAAKVDFTTGNSPASVAIGDLDGDGKPDLAVADFNASTISVLRNASTSGTIDGSSFSAKTDFASGSNPYFVTIADLDGDAKPEIVAPNYGSNTVSVLRNTATSGAITSGSFATHVDFGTGGGPLSVAIGDVNGDGKPDLTVANQNTSTVSVLRNTSVYGSITTGSFATKVDFVTGGSPRNVAVGDLDGDGKPDIAVHNYGSGTVSVLRNSPLNGIAPITGTLTVCAGATTSLSNATTGGTWSSTATGIATVDSSGVVTGVAAGTATISYIATAGSASAIVTVNALPTVAAITGNTTLSTAITTKLSDATTGGVWASSNTAVGTVNSGTGLVTGLTTGTSTISYTVTTSGCSATVTTNVTVNTPGVGIHFDGSNDRIDGTNSALPQGSSARTIEAWIKPTSTSGAQVIFNWGSFSNNQRCGLMVSNHHLYLVGEFNDFDATSAVVTANVWSHVAVTLTGTSVNFYINGVLAQSGSLSSLPATTGSSWSISNTNSYVPTREPFVGSIDEVRVWNTVRTQTEIAANMNCDAAQQTGLVAYYRFDNGIAGGSNASNNTAVDYSGNGACGTISNMALTGTSSNYVTGAVGNCNAIMTAAPGTFSGNAPVCIGSTITLTNTSTGGVWSTVSSRITLNAATGVVSGVTAGTAVVKYTLDCSTASVIVTVNALPTVNAGSNVAICYGAASTLTATGAATYSWSPSTGLSAGTGASVVASPTATTTYTVTGTGNAPYIYEQAFTNNVYSTPSTPQGIAWNAFIASLPSSGITGFRISGSNDVTGISCTNATVAQNIANALRTSGSYSNSSDGRTWVAGSCGSGMELNGEGSMCSCLYPGYTVRPSIGNENWGGINTVTCGGPSQTIKVEFYTSGGNSCSNTAMVTVSVNPLPVAATITGTASVCPGSTTTLADSISGGTWASSNAGIASVDGSGVVSGVTAGTATISYTVTTPSCGNDVATQVVTVNPLPDAGTITGTLVACAGNTSNLSNAVSGGTWSSSAPTIASADDTGIVSALAAGNATISYSVTNSCGTAVATQIFTVNALPDAGTILGDSTVSMGGTTTLTNAASGTWSGGNSRASISASGVVTGLTAGTATVSFTATTPSCGSAVTTRVMTVANPVVSGSPLLCVGTTTALAGVPSGGTWTSGNTPLAVVNASGVVTGLSAGTINISYVVSGSLTVTTVTVQTTPVVITGLASICNGASNALITTPTGGTWTTSDGSVAEVTSAGMLSGLSLGTSTISYTLANGCARSVVATINDVPAAITGFTSTCVGGSTTLTNAVSGGVFSSANSTIATCTMGGVVGGVAAGSTLISYSIGGCRTTTMVSVTAAPAITGTAAACVGATTALNNALAGGVWSSGNSAVADVDASGLVTGIGAGTAVISYSLSSGCARTQVVTINAIPAINGPSAICLTGGAVNFTATPASTSWTSSTPSVATINSSGLVSAASAGTTTISVTTSTGCTNGAVITVFTLPSFTSPLTACVSGTSNLTASVSGGTWSTTSTGIASVNASTGVVTGVNQGITTVSYSLGSGCLRTGILTVNPLPAIAGTPSMCVNGTVALAGSPAGGAWSSVDPLTATVSGTGAVTGQASGTTNIIYTNATTGCSRAIVATINATPGTFSGSTNICAGTTSSLSNATPGGTWSSNAPAFASAAVATGVITGAAAGVATITYRVGLCSATIPFTVRALPNTITGGLQTVVGATASLANTTPGGTWSSSNPAAGTISVTGVVTGLSAGTSTVVYTATNACTRSVVVTINAAPALPGPRSVCVGSTINISSPTVPVSSWISSTPSVATVSGGIVTGVSAGTTTITYNLTSGGWATTDITVLALPSSITGALNVCETSATALSSTPTGGAWTSANGGLATVNATGVVTGVAAGPVTITYTLPTGCRRTASVTVNLLPAAITGPSTVCAGTTMMPYLQSPTGGSWSSSNTAVATVPAAYGGVTGVTAGTALISLTNAAGCSISKEITVVVCPSRGMNAGTTSVTNLADGDMNISVYPNPTKGTFSVNTPEAGSLSISTIDGREVMKRQVSAGITQMTLSSDIAAGVYMCRFIAEGGAITTVRLVVEN